MRMLSLALALGIAAPARAAMSTADDHNRLPSPEPPLKRSDRRTASRARQYLAPTRSPCGRHQVAVDAGAVFVDGKRIHPTSGTVQILAPPTWRSDGAALAWLERGQGETRLVVLPEVAHPDETIVWPLPKALANDRPHWAGHNKVVVGPEPLSPRAVASWTDR